MESVVHNGKGLDLSCSARHVRFRAQKTLVVGGFNVNFKWQIQLSTHMSDLMRDHYAFVMMVQEKYWIRYRDRRHDGKMVHAYVARGKAPPKNARILLFYVSRPVKAICGHAKFVGREVGDSEAFWSTHSEDSVLGSKAEYEQFIGSSSCVSFIRFTDLCEASNSISLKDLLAFFGVKRLSRKGFYVGKEATDRLISMMM